MTYLVYHDKLVPERVYYVIRRVPMGQVRNYAFANFHATGAYLRDNVPPCGEQWIVYHNAEREARIDAERVDNPWSSRITAQVLKAREYRFHRKAALPNEPQCRM